MEKSNNASSLVKLFKVNNKESKVRDVESRRRNNTQTKDKRIKRPTGIMHQEDKNLEEQSVKRNMEGLKLKMKEGL